MAVQTSPIAQDGGVGNFASGGYTGTGSGTVTIIGLGFTPRRVVVYDTTDALIFEWVAGMGTSMFKLSNGALVVEASYITTDWGEASESETGVYAPGTSEAGDGSIVDTTVEIEMDVNPLTNQIVLSSALNTDSSAYFWTAEA